MRTLTTIGFAWFVFSNASCSGTPSVEPVFPASYADTFTEVRACRRSGDHDLAYVRILVDATARASYEERAVLFPTGSTIVKEEYAKPDCSDLLGWTAMQRVPGGAWRWQRVSADRTVMDDGAPTRCISCHQTCGVPPDGYDGTCAAP